jgi:hypothetical protein
MTTRKRLIKSFKRSSRPGGATLANSAVPLPKAAAIPRSLAKILKANLGVGEEVELSLKGMYTEALVCTNNRVMIIKKGYFTGHIFGHSLFQLPYAGITSAEVNSHISFGYFELSAGGVQSVRKSIWQDASNALHRRSGVNAPQSPQHSPNCVSLTRRMLPAFRSASTFILEKAAAAYAAAVSTLA